MKLKKTEHSSSTEYWIDPYHIEAVFILAGPKVENNGDKKWEKITTLYMDTENPINHVEEYSEKPDLADDFVFGRLVNERPELVWVHTENSAGDFLIGSQLGSLAYIKETIWDWNVVSVQLAFNNTTIVGIEFKKDDGGLEEAREFENLVASHFGSSLLKED